MKDGGFSPFYWDMIMAQAVSNVNGGSARLYKRPLILAASLVSTVGEPTRWATRAGDREHCGDGGGRRSSFGTGYADALPVLGKLTDFFIAPSHYGIGETNTLSIFFMTEQEVDAPSGFDFGQYCSASPLDELYYIPEGRGTSPLPTGELIPCIGAPTSVNELTFNRAKLSTTGRLLRQTFYGFQVTVVNAASYVRTQLDDWRLWTYVKTTSNGVDGAYETARVNERARSACL
eukprot:g11684.t1